MKIIIAFALCMWANIMVPFFPGSAENMYQNIVQEIAENCKECSDSDTAQLQRIQHVICDMERHTDWMSDYIMRSHYFQFGLGTFLCGWISKIDRFFLKAQIAKNRAVISKLRAKNDALVKARDGSSREN